MKTPPPTPPQNRMARFLRGEYLDDLLLLTGAALIVWGIAQIYIPAAWIAAGLFLIACAFLIAKERVENASAAEPGQK